MGELQIKDAALAVPPCQGGCREFESRLPLHFLKLILPSHTMTANSGYMVAPQFAPHWLENQLNPISPTCVLRTP